MKTLQVRFFPLLLLFFLAVKVNCQPPKEMVQVIVSPDHADWLYRTGEDPKFSVMVLRNYVSLNGITVNYEFGPEQMPPEKSGSAVLKDGILEVKEQGMKIPGFSCLTASVVLNGKKYASSATVGFSPEKIEPTTTLPDDFVKFWENAKNSLKKIPVNPILTLLPERCTESIDVYHVKIDNVIGKIYGILCKPKKAGKYPALLNVPGAGTHPSPGDIENASRGYITFQIGIHGIPVNLTEELYQDLSSAALKEFWAYGLDDRDHYYYKRVYLGCVRAVDFITGLEDYDGENLAVYGGSQGGALSIVTAALDSRVKCLVSIHPALCDLTGYLKGRASGWHHFFRDTYTNKPDKIATSKYYDAVNFARFIKVPGWYSWGYNDITCPPTSTYSAYNVITAPKELTLFPETQHWSFPEQKELFQKWLDGKLMNK